MMCTNDVSSKIFLLAAFIQGYFLTFKHLHCIYFGRHLKTGNLES